MARELVPVPPVRRVPDLPRLRDVGSWGSRSHVGAGGAVAPVLGALDHDPSTAHALHFRAWIAVHDHDPAAVVRPTEEARVFAEQRKFPFYLAMNAVLAGWATAAATDPERRRTQILKGLAGLAAGGVGLGRTFFLALLAEAHRAAGNVDDALVALDEAIDLVERNSERFYEAELHRLRGELLRSVGTGVDRACSELERALAVARSQKARPFEDRAAASLRHLSEDHGALGPASGDVTRQPRGGASKPAR